jgi:hypothetical protein
MSRNLTDRTFSPRNEAAAQRETGEIANSFLVEISRCTFKQEEMKRFKSVLSTFNSLPIISNKLQIGKPETFRRAQ